MSIFSDQFTRASEEFLERVKEVILVNNQEIEASVDPITFDDAIRSGGRTSGMLFGIHVRKTDWDAAGGKSGSKVTVSGKGVRAKSFVDIGDNQYEIMCETFKGSSGL